MSEVIDRWASASTYERFMGRWSRDLAYEFLTWVQLPAGRHWLEVGCGTGALTSAICTSARPASVVACDPAASFLEYARARCTDSRVSFVQAGVDAVPLHSEGYGSITSLLALNFFPDIAKDLERLYLAGSAGCVISACVWDYAEGMQFLRYFWDAAAEIDATAREQDEAKRFPICNQDRLRHLFRGVGLVDVVCQPIVIDTHFASFEDYWQPLLGATGPAPSFVAALSDRARAQLRAKLQSSLPMTGDGKVTLRARAWAVRGTKRDPARG